MVNALMAIDLLRGIYDIFVMSIYNELILVKIIFQSFFRSIMYVIIINYKFSI